MMAGSLLSKAVYCQQGLSYFFLPTSMIPHHHEKEPAQHITTGRAAYTVVRNHKPDEKLFPSEPTVRRRKRKRKTIFSCNCEVLCGGCVTWHSLNTHHRCVLLFFFLRNERSRHVGGEWARMKGREKWWRRSGSRMHRIAEGPHTAVRGCVMRGRRFRSCIFSTGRKLCPELFEGHICVCVVDVDL
uniref:Uncharacterized protein TCIL3000_10_6000 n=1 Tax=Trypanosoma congolense (strain IL3000) TaxID=1068625 RepID=G0UWR0_TRYCI|nr:unnamed protein product [Trypanosoma congolense IL3000]